MSKDTRPALDRSKVAAWVTFPDNAAKLNIIHVPGGAKGLFLRTVDTAAGAEIFDKAVDFGFSKLKAPGNLRILFPDGKIPLTAKALAEALGGKLFLLDKDELASDKWTINLSRRAPSVKEVVKPTAVEPDPDTFETIGLNARGNTVIRDKNGRFIRLGEGSSRYEFEGNGGHLPSSFAPPARRILIGSLPVWFKWPPAGRSISVKLTA